MINLLYFYRCQRHRSTSDLFWHWLYIRALVSILGYWLSIGGIGLTLGALASSRGHWQHLKFTKKILKEIKPVPKKLASVPCSQPVPLILAGVLNC